MLRTAAALGFLDIEFVSDSRRTKLKSPATTMCWTGYLITILSIMFDTASIVVSAFLSVSGSE